MHKQLLVPTPLDQMQASFNLFVYQYLSLSHPHLHTQLVVPTLLDQMQGEATRLQQSGRQVEWRMVKEPTLKDVKIVNGYLIK